MHVSVKMGRVWVANNENYKNKFLEIFIKNKNKKASFVCIVPKDGRFYIPLKIRNLLIIKDDVIIQKIRTIPNKKRSYRLSCSSI